MELSPSREAANCGATQFCLSDIPSFYFWNACWFHVLYLILFLKRVVVRRLTSVRISCSISRCGRIYFEIEMQTEKCNEFLSLLMWRMAGVIDLPLVSRRSLLHHIFKTSLNKKFSKLSSIVARNFLSLCHFSFSSSFIVPFTGQLLLRGWQKIASLPGNSCVTNTGVSKTLLFIFRRHAVALLVEALCYKPEGGGFDSRCHWIFKFT
jgi:hypothetical protein